VALTGPRVDGEAVVEAVARSVDEATGLWTFRYAVSTSGLYRLLVQLHGTHVAGSPFAVTAEPAELSIPMSTCTGEGEASALSLTLSHSLSLSLSLTLSLSHPHEHVHG
jgi:hypothetical protein